MRTYILLTLILLTVLFPTAAIASELILPSESLDSIYSDTLLSGQLYEFTVTGVYDYGNAPDTYADAEWSRPPNWSDVVAGYTYETDILDVVIDNTPVDWFGSSDGINYHTHTFSPSHVYKYWYTGAGKPVHFHIADLFPWGGDTTSDNEGSLSILVTPVPEPSSILILLSGIGGIGASAMRKYQKRSKVAKHGSVKKGNQINIILMIAIFTLMSLAACTSKAACSVFLDNFDDNVMDKTLWSGVSVSNGVTCAETNGQLEVALSANAYDDPYTHGFSNGYMLKQLLRGNLDIQVDYRIIKWPENNGVRLGINILSANNGSIGCINRASLSTYELPGIPREGYNAKYMDCEFHNFTDYYTGKMRLVRNEAIWSSYYWNTDNWVYLGSGSICTGDVYVAITAWSHDYTFANQDVTVAFDNFVVNQGQVVPEPSSIISIFFGIGGLSCIIWKRKTA